MGAKNTSDNRSEYYKLKEDKRDDSATKGQFVFFKQEKTAAGWMDGPEYNAMSGYVNGITVKEYEWQGKKKEAMNILMSDDEPGKPDFVITIGFDSLTAKNIINTLAGEPLLGVIQFTAGKPSEYSGKTYPTLWINNNGEKTKWKYSKENNNLNLVPKVTTFEDDDKNVIKKGVKQANDFWKKELEMLNARFSNIPKTPAVNNTPAAPATTTEESSPVFGADDHSDLPF
jgi:hypothetical protein